MPLRKLRSAARKFSTGVRKATRRQGFQPEFDVEAVSPRWKRGNVSVEKGRAVVQIAGRTYTISDPRMNEFIGQLKAGTKIEAIRHPMGELLLVQKAEGRKTVGQREPHLWVSAERESEVKDKETSDFGKKFEKRKPRRREETRTQRKVEIQPNWKSTTIRLPDNRTQGLVIHPDFGDANRYEIRLSRSIFDESVKTVEVCVVSRTKTQKIFGAPKVLIVYVPPNGKHGFLSKTIELNEAKGHKFQIIQMAGKKEVEIRPGRAGKGLTRFIRKDAKRR